MSLRAFYRLVLIIGVISICAAATLAQSLTAGTVDGVVVDPNKAAVPNATVTIENAVTGYKQTVNTGTDGTFRFNNLPLNNYVFNASAPGFSGAHSSVNVRSSVPVSVTTVPAPPAKRVSP